MIERLGSDCEAVGRMSFTQLVRFTSPSVPLPSPHEWSGVSDVGTRNDMSEVSREGVRNEKGTKEDFISHIFGLISFFYSVYWGKIIIILNNENPPIFL